MQIEVKLAYKFKAVCLDEAFRLVNHRNIVGMTIRQVAQEIHAHAVMYYAFSKPPWNHTRIGKYIIRHANPIDIEDGEDALHRRIIYRLIWMFVPSP